MLRIFSFIFLIITHFNSITHATFKSYRSIQSDDNLLTCPTYVHHEGFLSGTLIKTSSGYQTIETLNISDFICGKNDAQEILYIKESNIESYFTIKVDSQYIKVSSKQQFYLHDGSLQEANKLQVGDQLQNGSFVYEIYQVNEPCTCYLLSTQEQSFYLYPDILMHNFDVLTLGTASFAYSFGIIECSNPITLIVGGVYILSWYATHYFKQNIAYDFEFDDEDPDLTAKNLSLHNLQTIQETRSYYLAKRQELIKLYQTLIQLNTSLLTVIKPTTINQLSFSSNFLVPLQTMQFQQPALPDISYECKLPAKQKIQLLKARDIELEKLQQDVFDLHLLLAFYTNETIERRDLAQKEYKEISKRVNLEVNRWNYDLYNMSHQTALDHYAIHFLWQNSLDNLELKTNEVQFIIAYYQSIKNHFFVSTTTNLTSVLSDQVTTNKSIIEQIKTNRAIWHSNMLNTEDFLRKHNLLSQQLINQLKSKIQQERSAQEKELLSLSKKKKNAVDNVIQNSLKQQSSQQTPNIKGPDKDPDDDWFEKLKKNYERKALHYRFKKFYKDPQTKIWWSKDIDQHAGSMYKAFKEGATGLEWLFDADALGQKILEKHKSPVGKFIPYKELIFY